MLLLDKKKKKTELVTFRFEKEILESLKKSAEKKQVSLNNLISQIIKHHIDWHSTAPDFGIIPMDDVAFRLILKNFSKLELENIAKTWRKEYFESALLSSNRENTLESVIQMIENWGRIAGLYFAKKETSTSVTLAFRHNCGKNFSILISEMFLNMASEFPNKINIKNTIRSFALTILK